MSEAMAVRCETCGEEYEGPANDLGATIAFAFLTQHGGHETSSRGLFKGADS